MLQESALEDTNDSKQGYDFISKKGKDVNSSTKKRLPPPSLIFRGMHKTLTSVMSGPTLDSIN